MLCLQLRTLHDAPGSVDIAPFSSVEIEACRGSFSRDLWQRCRKLVAFLVHEPFHDDVLVPGLIGYAPIFSCGLRRFEENHLEI